MQQSFVRPITLLWKYLRFQKGRVLLLAFLLLFMTGLQLSNPQILGYFINIATTGGSLKLLFLSAAAFIACVLLSQLISSLANYLGEGIGWRTTNQLRVDLAEHCLNLDMTFFKTHTPGEMVERIEGDVATLLDFLSKLGVSIATDSLLLLGILTLTLLTDWRIGLFALFFTVGGAFILRRVQNVATPYARSMRQTSAMLSGFTEECLSALEDVNANNGREHVLQQLSSLLQNYLQRSRLTRVMSRVYTGTMEVGVAVGLASVLSIGGFLLFQRQISIGTLYALFYYIQLLAFNVQRLVSQFNDIQLALASVQRINELFQTRSEIVDLSSNKLLPGPMTITFDDVTFGYEPGQTVFKGLSFTLEAGKSLGLLGRTGSGKTTLSNLLFRFYDPQEGMIVLNETDIRTVSLSALRKRIGLVTQNVQIFQGTIRENLTFFDDSISDAQLLQMLDQVGLIPWIEKQPDELDTPISNQSLSAGEAQLLAFARVFLQNPDIIVLDEASSRLDPATERMLDECMARLLRQRTSIIIAHRLETLQRVDEVMILENGQIIEYGPRHQLVSNQDSRFSQLLEAGIVEVSA